MKKILLSLIAIIIILGCSDYNEKYGLNFNKQRELIGLPLLNENWNSKKDMLSENISWWSNSRGNFPSFIYKKVFIYKGDIIREENLFQGKKYTTVDGILNEELYIDYRFDNIGNDSKKLGFYCEYRGAVSSNDSITNTQSKEISKNEADSILKAWKL